MNEARVIGNPKGHRAVERNLIDQMEAIGFPVDDDQRREHAKQWQEVADARERQERGVFSVTRTTAEECQTLQVWMHGSAREITERDLIERTDEVALSFLGWVLIAAVIITLTALYVLMRAAGGSL